MRFRRVPSLDWDVSVLGVGAPAALDLASDASRFPEADFIRMFRDAVDHGVNYLDLGWFNGIEHCEPWLETVGAALADGYRERVRVAANVPSFVAGSREDWFRFLGELTAGLRVDALDLCIVGGVDRSVWERLVHSGLPDWADSIVDEGPVGALGFFICDDLQVLKRMVSEYGRWALCKLRYGFWDHLKSRPGSTAVGLAWEHGLMVVVGEPARGALAWHDGDGPAVELPDVAGLEGPPDVWALRWAWDDPGVSTVVCDLDPSVDLASLLELADQAEPRSLSVRELTALNRVRDHYAKTRPIPCTACRTCMPCSEGVDIPRILDLWSDASVYGGVENARATYLMEQHQASDCTACGTCEDACPWDIPIIRQLERAHHVLG
jgi:hypothetical protein